MQLISAPSAPEYQIFAQIKDFTGQKDQNPPAIGEEVKQNQHDQNGAKRQGDTVGQDPSGYWRSRPMAPATSAIRQEKPHSLSYQASTRTVRPPTTLVWSGAKIDE